MLLKFQNLWNLINVLIKQNYDFFYLSGFLWFFKVQWIQENQGVTFLVGGFLSQNTKKQNLSQKFPITFQSVNLKTLKQFEWQLTTKCQGILWVHAKDQPHAWTWLGLLVCDEISNLGQKQAWEKVTYFIVKSCYLKETFSNARQSEKFKPKKEHNF